MALDFPTSPALNQVYTFGSYSWSWDGTSWVGAVPIVNATINNTTIGAVTPSTGAFTTLSATTPIASSSGGTGNGFAKFSGPASSEKTFTLPNASSTLLYEGGTIGATTANTGAFTTLSSTGNVGIKGAQLSVALNMPNAEYIAWYNAGVTGSQDAAVRGSGGNLQLFGGGANSATVTSTGLNSTAIGATTASTGVFTNVRIGSATSDELLTINGSSAGFVSRITNSAASNPNGFYYNSTNAIGTGTAFRVDSQGVSLLTLNSTGLAVTGSVGIGTASPQSKLHIFNSTSATARLQGSRGTDGEAAVLNFSNTSDIAGGYIIGSIAVHRSGDDNSGAMLFSTALGASTPTERMRITSAGNVGIGTSSPAARLTVAKSFNISSDGAYAASSASGTGLNFGFDGAGTERSWIQALRNNTSETRELQLNPLGGTVSTGAALSVGGALSKASGSFRIEHPLPEKSATHQLVHSFIEGPQADLIYRGKVVLVDGKASVNIDAASTMTEGTFEVLCRDVQCFTTNESGWTAVRGKVTGNILTIEAKDADCTDEISWMVIGERQDPHMMETEWTDDNGKVIVEPLKPVIESSN